MGLALGFWRPPPPEGGDGMILLEWLRFCKRVLDVMLLI